MRWYIIAILIACSLSSCATLSAGYYADVYLDGYDGPLKVTDTAGNEHHVVQGRSGGKPYAFIELDKRRKEHTVVVSNGVETSTHYLYRHINFNWLIPNVINYEVGFIIDWSTGAVYDFPDIELKFRPMIADTPGVNDHYTQTERATRVRGLLSASIGMAMPASQPPQSFNGATASFAIRSGQMLAVGVDLSAGGTSFKGNSRTIYNMVQTVGPSVKLIIRDAAILSLLPAYQRVSSSTYSHRMDNVSLGAKNFFTVGAGLGARLGGFLIDFRIFPSFNSRQIDAGEFVSGGHALLTFGYSGEAVLFR